MEHRLNDYQERDGGWRPKAPSRLAEEIDSAVCAEAECDQCGHVGMTYHPMTRGRGYRAFARCPKCKCEVEF